MFSNRIKQDPCERQRAIVTLGIGDAVLLECLIPEVVYKLGQVVTLSEQNETDITNQVDSE